MTQWFSISRWLGIVAKEFIQLKRDRLTFGMIVGIPVVQLILFGFAINSDPKHLPTAALIADRGEFSRSILAGLKNSSYFDYIGEAANEQESDRWLATGKAQFVVTIPADFSRRLVRGERPALLLEADATDPAATGNAIAAVNQLAQTVLLHDLTGPLAPLARSPDAFEVRVHARYNPEAITQYNIVPGLMGVILTMTMVMMTGLAITRERERGTMENLLATPATGQQPIDGGGRRHLIAEDAVPLAEHEIARQQDRAPFVALREEREQHLGFFGALLDVAQIIEQQDLKVIELA